MSAPSSIPNATVLARAAEVAMEQDCPIYLDYYADSVTKKCCIGVDGDTKFLVKSDTEYTSPIQSIVRVKNENVYLVRTENSLYVVASTIPVKKVASSA